MGKPKPETNHYIEIRKQNPSTHLKILKFVKIYLHYTQALQIRVSIMHI